MFLLSSLITMQSLLVVSHTVCAHIGGPPPQKKKWRENAGAPPQGRGREWCPRNRILSDVYYHTKFAHSRSSRLGVFMEIRQKFFTLSSRLSRSFKVIGTDTDWSDHYDFLIFPLVFHSNCGPISYRFQDKKVIIARFSHRSVFDAPNEEVPLGIL